MTLKPWIVILYVSLWAGSLFAQVPEKNKLHFVDGVVSSVDGKIITQSELWAQGYLMLLQRGGKAALVKKCDEEYLKAVLQFMTMQMILADLGQQDYEMIADEGNVEENYEALLTYLGGPKTALELFAQHHLSSELVRSFIRRDNMASRALARLRKQVAKDKKGASVQEETMTLLDRLMETHEIVVSRIKVPPEVAKNSTSVKHANPAINDR
jgi:hypothetical protein